MSKEQDQSAGRDEPADGTPATPGGAGAGDHDASAEPGGAGAGGIRSTSGGLVVTAVGQTDVGRQRSVNQDSLGNLAQDYAPQAGQLGLLYAVADGMGGHSRGEVASALAIETIFDRYYASDPQEQPAAALARIIRDTNAAIHQAGRAGEGGGNMGTTLTIALLRDDTLYVGNVGDSRTYRIRGDQIEQLTRDHSLIQEQIDREMLTPEEARQSNIRNVITRAVGYREMVEPDTFTYPVVAGDIILLCSDGLHGLVEDRELAQVFATQPLEVAVPTLIELARERGGHDNITALAIRVDAVGAPSPGSLDKTEPFDLLVPSPDDSTDRFPTIKPDAGEAPESAASTEASDATAPTEPIEPVEPAGTASAASLADDRSPADSPDMPRPDDSTNVASVAPTAAAAATLTTPAVVAGPPTPQTAAAPTGTTADTSSPAPPPAAVTETSAPPAATAPPPPPPALPAADTSSTAPPGAPAVLPGGPVADTSPPGPPPSPAVTETSPPPPPPALPSPERQRRAPVWLLVVILLALLALIVGAIAVRAWNRRTAAPNPASAATVVVPARTPIHQFELPADLRAGAYTVVLRERNPLTVPSGQAQPATYGERELTRG